MINTQDIYAVAGVSTNPEKYGYKVFNDLLVGGYRVFGVNPKGGEVASQKLYTSLGDLPESVDCLVLVTQPEVSEKLVQEAIALGIKKIWFQPGSESDTALELCRSAQIESISNACIMVQRRVV